MVQGKIFQLNDERDGIVKEVVEREFARKARSPAGLELALNDAAFSELARLEDDGSHGATYWQGLYRSLGRMDDAGRQAELKQLLTRYTQDVVGNFDPRVYKFATRVVPMMLSILMRPQFALDRLVNLSTMKERILVQGDLDMIRSLAARGTLILVPTHLSNLDSLVIGWSLLSNKLPPFTYGAGKNLFSNRFIGYFMHNLGAYKVDRRLKFGLYKDVLKMYSQVLIERGYHSLFFPGGTRSRSGEVESKLKLGLLGTGLAANIENLKANKPNSGVFILPCTLNYHLVLEAETLIGDFLKQEGKHRYIIEDDESSSLGRLLDYGRKTMGLDSSMVIQYGAPMDLWGNRVDAEGRSYDQLGRPIDTRPYCLVKGEVAASPQRDAEYVVECGEAISKALHQNTVVLSTHLVAFALFNFLRRAHPDLDLYSFLRVPLQDPLSLETVYREVDLVRVQLLRKAAEGALMLGGQVRKGTVEGIVAATLRYFGMYHRHPVMVREEAGVRIVDLKLLLYYHNRLTGFGLEREAARPALAAVT